jgi:hypothetical protein
MNVWTERFVLLLLMAASAGLFFWGFCVFGLTTINHLASAFGGRFLARPMRVSADSILASWRFGPWIGTACPFCQTMLRDALGVVTQSPPKLLDIAQITAASSPNGTAVK